MDRRRAMDSSLLASLESVTCIIIAPSSLRLSLARSLARSLDVRPSFHLRPHNDAAHPLPSLSSFTLFLSGVAKVPKRISGGKKLETGTGFSHPSLGWDGTFHIGLFPILFIFCMFRIQAYSYGTAGTNSTKPRASFVALTQSVLSYFGRLLDTSPNADVVSA